MSGRVFAWGLLTGNNPQMPTIAYIALGSNQGNRQAHLTAALADLGLSLGVTLVSQSPTYETDPVGGPAGQGRFLNSVAAVNTDLSPKQLLQTLHQIEADQGRDRKAETQRCAPRTLDLDILLFGNQLIGHADAPSGTIPHPPSTIHHLVIPHPRMHHRDFVLRPLCDIAPDVVHPILKRTIRELLIELETPAK
jgi:2-amino-4-hydroxy-6-hydroxymethyldihydropteridine diphosphokinase